jgi:hypothetical protein
MGSTKVALERMREELVNKNKRTRPAAPGVGERCMKCLNGAWSLKGVGS